MIDETRMMEVALKAAKGYADEVLRAPLSELGGLLSDQIGYWRLKNQVKIILKARDLLRSNGIEPGKVLPDIFVPLIESGGNVSDESLSEMYSSLLAAHLDTLYQEVHPSYSQVLAQLSPLDAVIMGHIHASSGKPASENLVMVKNLAEAIGSNIKEVDVSLSNLGRLGIIAIQNKTVRRVSEKPAKICVDGKSCLMTVYGLAFFRACTHGQNTNNN